MSEQALPAELVQSLNELGFVLVEGDQAYTFVRVTIGAEMRVLVQAIGRDRWRVGVASRASELPGWLPDPVLCIPLQGLGSVADGTVLELTRAELTNDLARVLRVSVLPVWDRGSPDRRGE